MINITKKIPKELKKSKRFKHGWASDRYGKYVTDGRWILRSDLLKEVDRVVVQGLIDPNLATEGVIPDHNKPSTEYRFTGLTARGKNHNISIFISEKKELMFFDHSIIEFFGIETVFVSTEGPKIRPAFVTDIRQTQVELALMPLNITNDYSDLPRMVNRDILVKVFN